MNIKKTAVYSFLGVLVVIVAGSLFVGLIISTPSIEEYASRRNFDSGEWQKAEGGNDDVRIKMMDSLLHDHKVVGMSRSQIDALLGKPGKTPYFSDYEYVYWLGPERGFMSIDSEWLGLKFKDNVVTEASLLRD